MKFVIRTAFFILVVTAAVVGNSQIKTSTEAVRYPCVTLLRKTAPTSVRVFMIRLNVQIDSPGSTKVLPGGYLID
jgi:hypothetical protein